MSASDWIQGGVLVVALATLVVAQLRNYRLAKGHDARTETKLRIFYALREAEVTEDELLTKLADAQPTSTPDRVEVKKALYEMLTEQTVDFTEDGKWAASVSVDDE